MTTGAPTRVVASRGGHQVTNASSADRNVATTTRTTIGDMEILYIATCGASDPTRASIPWHLAVNGSIEAGQTTRMILAGDASELLKADVRDNLEGLGVPPFATSSPRRSTDRYPSTFERVAPSPVG